jgi:hypothetical protein
LKQGLNCYRSGYEMLYSNGLQKRTRQRTSSALPGPVLTLIYFDDLKRFYQFAWRTDHLLFAHFDNLVYCGNNLLHSDNLDNNSDICAVGNQFAIVSFQRSNSLLMFVPMKNIFLCFTLWFLCSALSAQTKDSVYLFCYFKGNGDGLHYAYSKNGYKWEPLFNDNIKLKPTVSRDKLFRDPCIIKGADGRYHMVWTVSWNDKGIGYASSKDLVHWSPQQFIAVMQHEDSARNTWAPEITYDPGRKEYMIYWATTISGRFPQKDTAAEGRYNHRIYYVTTKNFKKFSETKLLYEPGFSVIDASIVKNGTGWIMFLKNETRFPVEKNIRVASAGDLKGPYSNPGPPITGNYWAEGPTATNINGQWMVYFDKYMDHKYGAVSSPDLLHWTDISDKVSFPAGVRHGTVLKISKEEFERMRK